MKQNILIILAVVIIVAIGLLAKFYPTQTPTSPAAQKEQNVAQIAPKERPAQILFECKDKKTINATFHNTTSSSAVDIILSDNRTFSLPKIVSPEGTYYTNPDKVIVFWNKEATAFITENNKETFSNCIASPTQNSETIIK